MATHSSVLAWRSPGTGEPGGLPSVGSHRVGHDWSDLAAAAGQALVGIHKQKNKIKKLQCYELLQYPCLENPMNSMKKQNGMTQEDEPPGWQVSNMLLGKSGKRAPERMKWLGQRRNDTQLWMWLVVNVKFWIFIGRTAAENETPVFWPPDVKRWLIGKDSDARKDWRQEEKRGTQNEMIADSVDMS